jgi:hypothetical protein
MNDTVTFYYADILGGYDQVTNRSPTFSTAQDCIDAIGHSTKADIIRITSYCYSWERADCFRKEIVAKRRP